MVFDIIQWCIDVIVAGVSAPIRLHLCSLLLIEFIIVHYDLDNTTPSLLEHSFLLDLIVIHWRPWHCLVVHRCHYYQRVSL